MGNENDQETGFDLLDQLYSWLQVMPADKVCFLMMKKDAVLCFLLMKTVAVLCLSLLIMVWDEGETLLSHAVEVTAVLCFLLMKTVAVLCLSLLMMVWDEGETFVTWVSLLCAVKYEVHHLLNLKTYI